MNSNYAFQRLLRLSRLLPLFLLVWGARVYAQGGSVGAAGPQLRVFLPCPGERTAPGCELQQDVPLYRPFEATSRREVLTLPDDPNQSAPALVLQRNFGQWQQILQQKPRQLVVEVPVAHDSTLRLYLEASSLMNGATGTGQQFEGAYYMGYVLAPNGRIRTADRLALSFIPDEWVGLLFLGGQTWVMGGIPDSPYRTLGYGDQAMFQTMEVPGYFGQICSDLSENLHPPGPNKTDDTQTLTSTTCKEVGILFVIDFHTRNLYASNAAATNWITSIFNAVKFVFQQEDITVNIWGIDIMEAKATCPWDTCTTTASFLNVANTYADTRAGTWNLLHVVSRKSAGGGRAYLNVLCAARRFRSGVSCNMNNTLPTLPFPTPYYTWNVLVISHELGHNFGSQHTHNCGWVGGAIDGCYPVEGPCTQPPNPVPPFKGTIMSYCHTKSGIGIDLNLGFGPQPGDRIRTRFNAATCLPNITVEALTSPPGPVVTVCAPATSQVFTTPSCTNCVYQWFRDGNPITGAKATSFTATVAGEYHVVARNGACVATSPPVQLNFGTGPSVTALADPPTTLCPGNPSELTASGAVSYAWEPGTLSGSPVVVNPLSSTTYTLTATDANGCTSSATTTVTVTNNLNLGVTANPSVLCLPGDPATLTATGADTYEWQPGNLSGSSVTVNPLVAQTYTVTGTQSVCTATAEVQVTIFDTTPPAVSNASFCVGQFNAQVCVEHVDPNLTYDWYDAPTGGNLVQGNSTCLTSLPANAGTYVFYVEGVAGVCRTARNAVTVVLTIPPGPPATSPVLFCTGQNSPQPLVCIDSVNPLLTYEWYDSPTTLIPGPWTRVHECILYNTSTAGTATVYVRSDDSNGCISAPTPVAVIVQDLPAPVPVQPAPICPGNSVDLAVASPATGLVRWYNTATAVPSINALPLNIDQTLTVTPTSDGQCYWLEVSQGGCLTPRAPVCIQYDPTTPPPPGIGFDRSRYCLGQPINLTGVPAVPSPPPTYQWSGTAPDNSPISPLPSPNPISSYVPTQSGTYTFCAVQLGATCPSAPGCRSVEVLPDAVGGNANGPATACSGTSVTISNVGYTGEIQEAFVSTDGGSSWFPIDANASTASPSFTYSPVEWAVASSYCFRFLVGPCNPVYSQTHCVNVIPRSVGGMASSDQTICQGENAALLAVSGQLGDVVRWEMSLDNFATAPTPIAHTLPFYSPGMPPVSTCYRAVISNGGCAEAYATPACIQVDAPSQGGIVQPDRTICVGSPSGLLELSGQTGSVVRWETSTDGFATLQPIPSLSTSLSVAAVTEDRCFRAVVRNGACNEVPSQPVCITTQSLSDAGTLNGAATVCASETNTSTLCLTGFNGLIINWESTTDAVNFSNPIPINLNASCLTATNISQTTCYRVQVQNAPCAAVYSDWACITAQQPPAVHAGGNAPSCATSYRLNGNTPAIGTGTWSVSPAGPVIADFNDPRSMVTGLVPGQSYIFTWTIDDGVCTPVSDAAVITVDPLASDQALVATANPATICLGQPTIISAAGASTYRWFPVGGTRQSFSQRPAATTTYTVRGTTATGCTSTTGVTVTVLPLPVVAASASAAEVCGPVGSVTLSATGADTYTWRPGNLTGQTVTVSLNQTRTYTVRGFDTNGCSNSATVTVTLLTAPTVTAAVSQQAICAGGSTTLSATGAGSYLWQPVNQAGSSIQVNPSATTVYTVVGLAPNSCTATARVTVNVNPSPTFSATASATTLCQPGLVTLSATGSHVYRWQPGNLTGASVQTVVNQTTTFTVTATTAQGCTAANTVTVSVGKPPLTVLTPSAISCAGAPVTLAASGPGSFVWQPGSLNGPTVTVAPTSTTVYTVTLTDGPCSTSAAVLVSVQPNPPLSASTLKHASCADAGIIRAQYTGPMTSRPYSFRWEPGNLTGAQVAVQPTSPTTYTVTITDGLTGCSNTAQTTVLVVPAPATIIGLATQYPVTHGPVVLSGTPAGGMFSGPGITGNVFNPGSLAPGTYTICYESTDHECPFLTCQTVIIESSASCPAPLNFSLSGVYSKGFTANWPAVAGAFAYELEVRNLSTNVLFSYTVYPPPFPAAVSYSVIGLSPTVTYSVRVRSRCQGLLPSPWIGPQFVQLPARLQAAAGDAAPALRVYPNPNRGQFVVELESPSPVELALQLHDLLGRRIWSGGLPEGSTSLHVELPDAAAGVYLLRIAGGTRNETLRIVVE